MADTDPQAPDFAAGVPLDDIPAGDVLGVTLDGEPWLLARVAGEVVAVGGACTHYSGPLAKGLRAGDTVRCPWHHACFSLRTGEALEAPAFDPLPRRAVRIQHGRAFPGDEIPANKVPAEGAAAAPSVGARAKRIVVVGAGAAGFAAVDRLKRLGHNGALTWLDVDPGDPCDRPKLSKDYLAGKAQSGGLPLGSQAVGDLRPRRVRAVALHRQADEIELEGGERVGYDALLLAPGAEPKRPGIPGFDRPDARTLRTRADAEAIVAALKDARRAVVVGSGFIGLEVAASLRQRGLEVAVVTPEPAPLASRLGPELAAWIRGVHEKKGVVFHLEAEAAGWDGRALGLANGAVLAADLLVVGVGVSPRLDLARSSGLAADDAIPVDASLRVHGAQNVWAAGDAVRFPDAVGGEAVRVEHWVAAERQGQIAAAAMLGLDARWAEPAFFWSAHYGTSLRYVGHAEAWDAIKVEGDLAQADAEIRYLKAGRVRAVATLGRDMAALKAAEVFRQEAATR